MTGGQAEAWGGQASSRPKPGQAGSALTALKGSISIGEWTAAHEWVKPLIALSTKADSQFEDGDIAGAQRSVQAGYDFAAGQTDPARYKEAWEEAHRRLDNLLGRIYLEQGQNDKALSIFAPQSSHVWPGHPVGLDIAQAYAQQGDFEKALHSFPAGTMQYVQIPGRQAAPSELPGTASLAALTASIHLIRGALAQNPKEEFREFQRAYKSAPHNPLIAYKYGEALTTNGRPDEARTVLAVALKGPADIAHFADVTNAGVSTMLAYRAAHPSEKPNVSKAAGAVRP